MRAISRVFRTFSPYASHEQSYITDVNPSSSASSSTAGVYPWSRCTATGTLDRFAIEMSIAAASASGAFGISASAVPNMIGARSFSAADSTPRAISNVNVLTIAIP